MNNTFEIHGESYTLVICYGCGVRYLIPTILDRKALERRGPNGASIHCPNGHNWHYTGETEAQKLRRERDRLQQQIARVEDEKREAEEAARKSQTALQRHKKRAAAGTCPCCKRTFSNMSRHMKSQHPGFGTIVELKKA